MERAEAMKGYDLKIVTPDGVFFSGKVEKLIVRTTEGDVCILRRHANLVAALGEGMCRVYGEGGVRRAACMGGMLSVMDGSAGIFATTFEWTEDIDLERAMLSKKLTEQKLQSALSEKERVATEAKLRRALVRLEVKKYR